MRNLKNNVRALNLVSGIGCQIVAAISGLILPNMILNKYGSVLYGLVSTITQMIAYLSLVEMGITSASLVSLYKPMANKRYDEASFIMSAVNKFYQRIALLFSIGVIGCGILAILIIKDDIPISIICLVVFVLASNNFVSYWLLSKYKVLLQSDDKLYVINIAHLIGIILQFALSIISINLSDNIAVVKSAIVFANFIEWLLLLKYCNKYLPDIRLDVKPAYDAIKQRKDILVHQVLALILNNTDILLLTIFSPSLSYVSIYAIYGMVSSLLQNIVNCFVGMFSAKMGQLYANGFYDEVRKLLNKYELVYDIALNTIYISMAILIMPFISIYTKKVIDTNYYLPVVGLLFSIYGITRMLRLPYTEITFAAGHFKETKVQAIIEASINLAVSIILLPVYGISGVLLGSVLGEVYRTIHSYIYCYKKLINFDWIRSAILCAANCMLFCFIYCLMKNYRAIIILSYLDFFVLAIKVTLINTALVILVNVIFDNIYRHIKRFVNNY